MIKKTGLCFLLIVVSTFSFSGYASPVPAHEVIYEEKEDGTDFYIVKYTVSEDLIRIDDSVDPGENESGYIIFDLKKKTIYSVSHFDKTILVIPEFDNDMKNAVKPNIIYNELDDAPTISGKKVFNYTVMAETKTSLEKCMDIQLASGLLPSVTSKLKQYQSVVSSQQVKTIASIPDEYKTACYLVDQIYNRGDYYDKGLPLREWHSNNRVRVLSSFDEVEVDSGMFALPKEYKQFSLDELKH